MIQINYDIKIINMNLATAQKLYDAYKLYYVNGNLEPITNVIEMDKIKKGYIIIPSLHLAGPSLFVKGYLLRNKININTLNFIDDKTPINEPILQREISEYYNFISKYVNLEYFNSSEINIVDRLVNTIRENLIHENPGYRADKMEVNIEPNEVICSEALIKYRGFKLPWNNNKNLIEYLMERSPEFIANVLGFHGINNINATIDVFYDFSHLLNRFDRDIIHKNIDDISYLSSLNIDQLISVAMKINEMNYIYRTIPWGHAYLLYGVLTGYFIPVYSERYKLYPHYDFLLTLEPYKISAIINQRSKGFYIKNDIPPYKNVNRYYDPDKLDYQLILANSVDKIDLIAEKYKILIPPQITDPYDKYYYCFDYIIDYIELELTNIPLPDSLHNFDNLNIFYELARGHTDYELINKYPITDIWVNRYDLIRLIFENYRGPVWRIIFDNCKNDDTFNIIEGELHGNIDKNNPEDLTLSYGTWHNYNCYQASELEAAFNMDNSGFSFNVPDYIDENLNIERRGLNEKEFPHKSIVQLLNLLKINDENKSLKSLYYKVTFGLAQLDKIQLELNSRINEYNSFSEFEKKWAKIYLVWGFLFSMWMRFWKGPGNPYPYDTLVEDVCEPAIRDQHIIIQLNVRQEILKNSTPSLLFWIKSLPLAKYEFREEHRMKLLNPGTLENMIDEISTGDGCMGFSSDYLTTTFYSLIKYILKYDVYQFDILINEYIPVINSIELNSILQELPYLIESTPAYNIYNERFVKLNEPFIPQDHFVIVKMRNNKHFP